MTISVTVRGKVPNSTAPLEPSSVDRIALVVKTYGEMDPIQFARMMNQMESYKPDAAAPSAFPLAGKLFLETVA